MENLKFEEFVEASKRAFDDDHESFVNHVFAVASDDTPMFFSTHAADDMEKNIILATIEAVFAYTEPSEYYSVSDAWVVQRKVGDVMPNHVRDEPDRTEALVIVHVTIDGNKRGVVLPYERNGEQIVWKEPYAQNKEAFQGRFTELLCMVGKMPKPPQSVKEKLDMIVQNAAIRKH
jgi:hypothetical protein